MNSKTNITQELDRRIKRRKQVEQSLKERLKFEELISELTAGFINLPIEKVDAEIEDAQRRVCEYLGLDLAGLWQWSVETPGIATLTHLYRPLGGPQRPDPMYGHEYFPWCKKELEAGRIINVSSVDALPAEAAQDQETLRHFGIKSVLTFPLSIGESQPIGALSFNTMLAERTWPETLVKRLQLVAQTFTNAILRKQTDTALYESNMRLSMTTEVVGAGLWIMDVHTRQVWVSPKGRELFHFAPDEEIYYERYLTVIHPDDRDRVDQVVQHALRSGEFLHSDYRIVLPGGGIRWIASRGRKLRKSPGEPERMLGLSLDITERKEIELHLGQANALLDALVNSTSDMIWSVDPERFGLLTFNRGLFEYFLHQRGIRIEAGMRPESRRTRSLPSTEMRNRRTGMTGWWSTKAPNRTKWNPNILYGVSIPARGIH